MLKEGGENHLIWNRVRVFSRAVYTHPLRQSLWQIDRFWLILKRPLPSPISFQVGAEYTMISKLKFLLFKSDNSSLDFELQL